MRLASALENAKHSITASKKGDFIIDTHYTIEVGGKNKSFKQSKDLPNSFVVADEITQVTDVLFIIK